MKAADRHPGDATCDFRTAFKGRFIGLMQWADLDALWDRLRTQADDNWYIYAIGEKTPDATAASAALITFIDEIDALLRREHQEDYCGIVYTNDREQPTLIKIFDPNNLGVSCGFSDNPPLPGWVLSRMPPVTLDPRAPVAMNRRRWWHRLWPHAGH